MRTATGTRLEVFLYTLINSQSLCIACCITQCSVLIHVGVWRSMYLNDTSGHSHAFFTFELLSASKELISFDISVDEVTLSKMLMPKVLQASMNNSLQWNIEIGHLFPHQSSTIKKNYRIFWHLVMNQDVLNWSVFWKIFICLRLISCICSNSSLSL